MYFSTVSSVATTRVPVWSKPAEPGSSFSILMYVSKPYSLTSQNRWARESSNRHTVPAVFAVVPEPIWSFSNSVTSTSRSYRLRLYPRAVPTIPPPIIPTLFFAILLVSPLLHDVGHDALLCVQPVLGFLERRGSPRAVQHLVGHF